MSAPSKRKPVLLTSFSSATTRKKYLYWSLFVFLILIIQIASFTIITTLIFHPKIPNYSVDRLMISVHNLSNPSDDASLNLTVTAVNPNDNIGIFYDKGSSLNVRYKERILCKGKFPTFYQAYRSTDVFNLKLTAGTDLSTRLLIINVLMQLNSGSVPLIVLGVVPVRVKFGTVKLFKVRFKFRCNVEIDRTRGGIVDDFYLHISIVSSSCTISVI